MAFNLKKFLQDGANSIGQGVGNFVGGLTKNPMDNVRQQMTNTINQNPRIQQMPQQRRDFYVNNTVDQMTRPNLRPPVTINPPRINFNFRPAADAVGNFADKAYRYIRPDKINPRLLTPEELKPNFIDEAHQKPFQTAVNVAKATPKFTVDTIKAAPGAAKDFAYNAFIDYPKRAINALGRNDAAMITTKMSDDMRKKLDVEFANLQRDKFKMPRQDYKNKLMNLQNAQATISGGLQQAEQNAPTDREMQSLIAEGGLEAAQALTGLKAIKAGTKGLTLAKVAKGALQGGGYGAGFGAVNAYRNNEDIVTGAGQGMLGGAVFGGALPVAGYAGGKIVGGIKKSLPDVIKAYKNNPEAGFAKVPGGSKSDPKVVAKTLNTFDQTKGVAKSVGKVDVPKPSVAESILNPQFNSKGYEVNTAERLAKNINKAGQKFDDDSITLVGRDLNSIEPAKSPNVVAVDDLRVDKTKEGREVIGEVVGSKKNGKADVVVYKTDGEVPKGTQLYDGNGSAIPISKPRVETPFGFNQSAKGSEFVSPQAKSKLEGSSFVRTNEELQNTVAAKLDNMDAVKAHEFALKTNSDEGTAAAIELAQKYRKEGNFDLEAQLINEKARRLREAGREVQAASLIDEMSPEGVVANAAQTIQRYNETAKKPIQELTGSVAKEFSDRAVKIGSMAEGRAKNLELFKLKEDLLNLVPSTFADKAITVWKAGLLTSLRTHERNLLGNTIMSASEVAKDVPASFADKVMSMVTGKRTLTPTVRGLGEFGSKKTRQEIADLVVHGVNLSDDISKYDMHHITWADTPIQQGLKHITDTVFRTLGAEDRAFANAAYARSLWDQAGAAAINAGKKGDVNFMRKLVNKPTEDMMVNATKDAAYATFHDKNVLGGAASSIKKALSTEKFGKAASESGKVVGEVLAPFTGVPSSIVGKTVAYSPIGLVKGAVDFGRVVKGSEVAGLQRKAAQEIGRGVVGTGLFGLGAYLMNKGLMTGQPKDKKEADLWAAEGKQANSVLINGKWRSINSIGPQNIVMLAGGKFAEPDKSLAEKTMSLGKDQLSQTFLAGVQGPLNAVTDPARYGQSYVGNQAASVVPNIIKDTSKAFDSKQRENNTIGDYFQNSIPGWRNQNIVKRDVLGQEMKQEPTGINAFVDLFNSKTPKTSETLKELDRLYKAGQEATPSAMQKSFKVAGEEYKLDPAQLNELEKQSGGILVPKLEELVNSDVYKVATDEEKKNAIGDVVKDVKDNVKTDYALGTSGTQTSNVKVNVDLEKKAFEKSGQNFQEKDGMIYRKKTDGSVDVMTKDSYDYKLGTAKLSKYKRSDDINSWMKQANSQLDSIEKQIQDPNVDELDKVTLEEDYNALFDSMEKYSEYGGFTKPKSGKAAAAKRKASLNNFAKLLETNTSSSLANQKALRNLVKGIKIKKKEIKA